MKWTMILLATLSVTTAMARPQFMVPRPKLHIPVSKTVGGPEEKSWMSRIRMGSVQSRAVDTLVSQARADLAKVGGFTLVVSPTVTRPIYDRLHDEIRELLSDDQWMQLVLAVKHRSPRLRPIGAVSL